MNVIRTIEDLKYQTELVPDDVTSQFSPSRLMKTFMLEHARSKGKDTELWVDLIGTEQLDYLIIYILDMNLGDGEVKTIVCTPDSRLRVEEEELLISYCDAENTYVNDDMLQEMVGTYNRWVPHTNLVLYKERPAMSIMHMYFCLFRGSCQELLYKAQLPYLATAIHRIDEVNLLPVLTKGTPVDLFESGFTIKLLRLLDNDWGIKYLLNAESRAETLAVYKRFSRNLGGFRTITHSQWLYLRACHRGKLDYIYKLYRMFGRVKDVRLYEDYVCFLTKRKMINQKIPWEREIDSADDLMKGMEEADYYLQYLMDQNQWDNEMWTQKFRLMYLDYSDEQYVCKHPSVVEIFDESNAQGNCLKSLYRAIAKGLRDIGFMRKASDPEKSFVTFEVENKRVTQLFGKNNRFICKSSEEYRWFTSVYMKEKGLQFDRYLYERYKMQGELSSGGHFFNVDDVPFV